VMSCIDGGSHFRQLEIPNAMENSGWQTPGQDNCKHKVNGKPAKAHFGHLEEARQARPRLPSMSRSRQRNDIGNDRAESTASPL
jgi:hypothetical protein